MRNKEAIYSKDYKNVVGSFFYNVIDVFGMKNIDLDLLGVCWSATGTGAAVKGTGHFW